MNSKYFSEKFIVPAAAIDALEHVNNLSYLQWCLDAAGKHWISKSTKQLREDYVWVVLNHSIFYKASAFEGEELEITTWVANCEGVKSERHYKIIRLKDKKTLIEAKTIWCLLNRKKHRPTKITQEIATLFL